MKNKDHKNVPKQNEDTGYLQILLHLRSLFWLLLFKKSSVKLENAIIVNAIAGILNVIEFANN